MYLNSYLHWRGNEIYHNQSRHLNLKETRPERLLQVLYDQLDMGYPKFFKMDMLCRAAMIATALLQPNSKEIDREKIALVFTTASGCIDVDKKFEESRKTFASPALFVYTLPNIMLGEISIRYGIQGEQMCSIASVFNSRWFAFYTNNLMLYHDTEACIFGHIEATADFVGADLFWATLKPQPGLGMISTEENIAKLIRQH